MLRRHHCRTTAGTGDPDELASGIRIGSACGAGGAGSGIAGRKNTLEVKSCGGAGAVHVPVGNAAAMVGTRFLFHVTSRALLIMPDEVKIFTQSHGWFTPLLR